MNSVLETICSVCTQVKQKTKQGTSFQNLLLKIRKEFKDNNLLIQLRSERKKFLNEEEFYVNAYYDAEDDKDGAHCIEVIAYHNFDKNTVWDSQHTTDFLIQIFDAVVHEYKHQRQSRKRNYNEYWDKVDGSYHYHIYLSDPDEVDAYALSIAIELCRSLGKYRALRYLPKFKTLAKLRFGGVYASTNLHAYVSHFETLDDPVLRTLAKKIYIRLQKIDTDFIFV